MPITDPRIPIKVLDALQNIGLAFAVIHGEPEVGSSQMNSDVDLVVGLPAAVVVTRVSKALSAAGLQPALLWPYDLGGTAGLFVTTETGDEGAQIDLLYDPSGRGRYGICTGVMLANSVVGTKYRVPSPVDQQLYLLRKRASKGQVARIEEHVATLAVLGPREEVLVRARSLFSPKAATDIERLLLRGVSRSNKARRPMSSAVRLIRRLRKPVGLWVELIGDDTAAFAQSASLEARFGRWLICTGSGRRPRGVAGAIWFLRVVSPVRLRPGLFLSWAETPGWLRADLTLYAVEGEELDRNARAIVEAFTAKVTP